MIVPEFKFKKTLAKMEEEARDKHMLTVLHPNNEGKLEVRFFEAGSTIRMLDGKLFRADEHGSLRRIKEEKKK